MSGTNRTGSSSPAPSHQALPDSLARLLPDSAEDQRAALAGIRHELRTPINHIIGYSEMLSEDVVAAGKTEFLKDLEKIQRGGKQLLDLINEYFDPDTLNVKNWDAHSVLHELRTPVSHIIGYTELLQDQAEEVDQKSLIPDLKRIHAAATHWLRLTEGYLISPNQPTPAGAPATRVGHESDGTNLRPGDEASSAAAPAGPSSLEKSAAPSEQAGRAPSSSATPQSARTSDTAYFVRRARSKGSGFTATQHGSLLVVDDDAGNRDMLARRLQRQGFDVATAENGDQALELIRARKFDLVLLDMIMPGIDGYEVLERIKTDPDLRHVPVLMISALDDLDGIVRCIEIGAEDYISKPFNPVFLRARISAVLEKKRLRDQEQIYLKQIQDEQEKAERLLLNILPAPIADRLKRGEQTIADSFPEVTVLFGDLVGFTTVSMNVVPSEMVKLLNTIFSAFDDLAGKHGLEKIKTIGDAYMAVSGLPTARPDHAEAAAEMALEMQEEIARFNHSRGTSLQMRVGLNTGPVIAGIIGTKKFIYDLWGDTVNTASRMESHATPGHIQLTQATYEKIRDRYHFEARGVIEVKGKGGMRAYWLTGRQGLTQANTSA